MESLAVILNAPIRNTWAASIDLKDAYLHIPIHPADWKWLRFKLGHQTYEFRCLPFGLSTAPRVFTRVVQEIAELLRRRGVQIFMYLDDWLILGTSPEVVQQHLDLVMEEVTNLGFIVNLEKSNLVPSQEPIFLGAKIDLREGKVFPTTERALALSLGSQHLASKSSAPAIEWLRVLGMMASMVNLIPLCKLHMRKIQLHFLTSFNIAFQPETSLVSVPTYVKRELQWWVNDSNTLTGVRFPPAPHQEVLTTDASKTGWGGFIGNESAKGSWSSQELFYHINMLELWAVRNSLLALEHRVIGKKVMIRSDNSTVVAYINKEGGTRSISLCRETILMFEWCIERNIQLLAIHIPGVENTKADCLSRDASLFVGDWAIAQPIFKDLIRLRNFPTIDLFASRTNNKLPVFCSRTRDHLAWETNAMSFSWKNLAGYAFPPIGMIPRIIQKIQVENCLILLIAPLWPQRHWFQSLLNLSVMDPISLPPNQDLLRLPKSKARFHNIQTLRLTAWTLSNDVSKRRDYLKSLQDWQPGAAEPLLSKSTLLAQDISSNGATIEKLIRLQPM